MYKSNCYEHRVVGDRNSLIKDQIKHTTFCAKFRNARCSNLSPSNRFVDLKPKKKKINKKTQRELVAAFRNSPRIREFLSGFGFLHIFLQNALVDVCRPDSSDAEGENKDSAEPAAVSLHGTTEIRRFGSVRLCIYLFTYWLNRTLGGTEVTKRRSEQEATWERKDPKISVKVSAKLCYVDFPRGVVLLDSDTPSRSSLDAPTRAAFSVFIGRTSYNVVGPTLQR